MISVKKKYDLKNADVHSARSKTKNQHKFSRHVWSAELWRKAIDSPLLTNIQSNDLQKFTVCRDHFTASDYSTSFTRKTLNTNAVPSVKLQIITSNETNVSHDLEERFEANDAMPQCELENIVNPSSQFTDNTTTVTDETLSSKQNGVKRRSEVIGNSARITPPPKRHKKISSPAVPHGIEMSPEVSVYVKKLENRNAILNSKYRRVYQLARRQAKRLKAVEVLMKEDRVKNWDKLGKIPKDFVGMLLRNAGIHRQVLYFYFRNYLFVFFKYFH